MQNLFKFRASDKKIVMNTAEKDVAMGYLPLGILEKGNAPIFFVSNASWSNRGYGILSGCSASDSF